MAQQIINVGASPNDGDGNPIRTAFIKCNDNFSELYSRVQESVPSSPTGTTGDTAGMMAFDNQYLYICVADFDDTTEIWRRVAFDTNW